MAKENKKLVREIGVWDLVRWVSVGFAGLISIFSAVVTIKAGQLIVGILFLIPGIFVFVPKERLHISRALKVIIFIVAYFTLLILSGVNAPKLEQQYEYYNLGETFELIYGEEIFSMKIENISKETQIVVNDGQNLTTSGFYLSVNGVITNLGKTTASNTNLFSVKFVSELKDSDDNVYSLLATNSRSGSFQPGLERKFYDIFEIPKHASGLEFHIKDKTGIIKVVNLRE